MGGQRHQGLRTIDRYMTPQARSYNHFHGFAASEQPADGPEAAQHTSPSRRASVTIRPDNTAAAGNEPVPGIADPLASPNSKESDAIVIFLPILGFERHRQRKYLSQNIRDVTGEDYGESDSTTSETTSSDTTSSESASSSSASSNPAFPGPESYDPVTPGPESHDPVTPGLESHDPVTPGLESYDPVTPDLEPSEDDSIMAAKQSNESLLLEGYLESPEVKPMHCRRTLDQFSYYMLESTELRDKGQVAYRWAKKLKHLVKKEDRPIIMVDQLWLWVLHDGTVITSFPSTWNGYESFDLTRICLDCPALPGELVG
jgi:hypothetical protein